MIDIRLPNINGTTEAEQLAQIRSYLYQVIPQLQWALSTVQTSNGTAEYAPITSTTSTSSKKDPVSNFNEIKGLIIKSADIVEAYYEKIEELINLSGKYVAQSDFGKYTQETNNKLSANDKRIEQNITDLQSIYDENGNIKAELLVNGHIYSGIIEYAKDGEAIVGIEIGQTTYGNGEKKFDKFARFTADRLEFYDVTNPKEPVAYISNLMLVITEAYIKGNLQIGSGFKFDTSNGIALIPV